jgi:hypothetical protein
MSAEEIENKRATKRTRDNTKNAAMSVEEREDARKRKRHANMSAEEREIKINAPQRKRLAARTDAMSAEEIENKRATERKRDNAKNVAMSADEREIFNARRRKMYVAAALI